MLVRLREGSGSTRQEHQRSALVRWSLPERSLKREESFSGSWSGLNCAVELLVAAPTVEEADMLVEELDWALRQLEPGQREIVELRLDGVPVNDIAVQVGRTERTVHRVLARVRKLLEERGSADE